MESMKSRVSSSDPIDVIIENKRLRHQEFRSGQSRDLVYIQMEQLARPMKFGLLNIQSIGNKSAIVAECITSHDFRFVTAVET